MWQWQVCGQRAVNTAVACMQERQRKLEQEVAVVTEEEPVPEPAEPAPPLKQPSGPLTLAQVAAANVPEVEAPAEAVVSTLLLTDALPVSYGTRGHRHCDVGHNVYAGDTLMDALSRIFQQELLHSCISQ